MPIALDRFVEAKRGDPIDFCQVAIQHDAHPADRANHPVNLLDWNGRFWVSSALARKIIQKLSR